MFPTRYFCDRMFAPRYFAKVGASISITRFVELTLGARPSYSLGALPAFAVGGRTAQALAARPSYTIEEPPALTIEGEE